MKWFKLGNGGREYSEGIVVGDPDDPRSTDYRGWVEKHPSRGWVAEIAITQEWPRAESRVVVLCCKPTKAAAKRAAEKTLRAVTEDA